MEENTLRLKGKVYFTSDKDTPPFFWLGFLDEDLLASAQDGIITIDPQSFSKNAERMRDFLADKDESGKPIKRKNKLAIHDDAMPMFMDFFRYIRKYSRGDKDLILEMPILLKEEGRAQVKRELAAIAEGRVEDLTLVDVKESPHFSCGWPKYDSFDKFAYYYRKLGTIQERKNPEFDRGKFIQHILLLLLCPVLTYMVVTGYLDDGFSMPLALVALGNIIFYIYSIAQIQVQWKLLMFDTGRTDEQIDADGWIDDF